jgi:hypothetical protein
MAACCKNEQPGFAYTGKQQNKSICVKKLANNLRKENKINAIENEKGYLKTQASIG